MNALHHLQSIFFLLLWCCGSAVTVQASPLPAPEPGEQCRFGSVVIASYQNYSEQDDAQGISYFHPPLAHFTVTELLHGPELSAPGIAVRYEFHDGSACIEPESWQFDPATMLPEAGSTWLLSLRQREDTSYETYRGDVGRVPAGPQATAWLEECKKIWQDESPSTKRQ